MRNIVLPKDKAHLAPARARTPPRKSRDARLKKADVDAVVETMLYLYTESRRLTKELAREFGLTGPQLTVVKLLESLGDLSLSSLSERIRAQNSTVTGIIDRMEREGLVRRERPEHDRRVVLIRLTDKGKKLAARIEVEPMQIFRQALEELAAGDLIALFRILSRMAESVRRALGPLPEAPDGRARAAHGERSADEVSPAARDSHARAAHPRTTHHVEPAGAVRAAEDSE